MRVVVLSLEDPWARSHGGTQRTLAFIESFRELGHEVLCVFPGPAGPAEVDGVARVAVASEPLGERPWPAWLRRTKRHFLPMPTQLGGKSLAISSALRRLAPFDLLVTSYMRTAVYRSVVPSTALWLDHGDVLSDFARREAGERSGLARETAKLQQRRLAALERRLSDSAEIVTAAGWTDAQLLATLTRKPVTWVPNPVRRPEQVRFLPEAERTAGFLGNFTYWPNIDALDVLFGSWAPRLWERGWRVVVAGYDSERLSLPSDVEVWGSIERPADFYERVALTLVPVRRGGGMKVKVVESLMHGRPVVASAHAVEGFPPSLRRYLATVDLLSPEFGALPPALGPGLDVELGRFHQAAFTAEVRRLLSA